MTTDPFKELFQSIDPTRGLSDADIDKMVAEAKIVERAEQRARTPYRRWFQRRWRRTAVISIVAIVGFSGVATSVTLFRSGVSDPTQMECYSQDAIHSKVIVEEPYGPHLLATCATQFHWKSLPSSPAPHGLLCVLPSGILAGFPPSKKYSTCSSIGLQAFNGHLVNTPVVDFERAADEYFATNSCPRVSAAKHEMTVLMTKYGLTAWQLLVYGSSSPLACATFGLESDEHTIDIVGIVKNTP